MSEKIFMQIIQITSQIRDRQLYEGSVAKQRNRYELIDPLLISVTQIPNCSNRKILETRVWASHSLSITETKYVLIRAFISNEWRLADSKFQTKVIAGDK